MGKLDLIRLNDADQAIQGIAKELGLSFMPQEFDVIPAQKMLEIMAYRLPVNYSHWSFGRDYETERTKWEHGWSVPYEVVFNSNPCRAYLMESNPFAIQVLVMAHVYAHNDFMTESRHFQSSRRDMITSASEAAGRFREYEERFGREEMERTLDAALALEWNIDPEEPVYADAEARIRERLYGRRSPEPAVERRHGSFDDLLGPGRHAKAAVAVKEASIPTPPEPTVDILGYLLEHSPKPLAEWQQDVIATVRAQAQYFMPYRRTKIMNEGWATYWHEQIMGRLFAEGVLSGEDHGLFNLYNARVKAHNPRQLNPYLLGYKIFADIERRWDSGRYGPEWEGCEREAERRAWDRHLGGGRGKLFEVRRTHMDWFFVDEFLSPEVIEELELYLYLDRDAGSHVETVVEETDWRVVKHYVVRSLMNWGVPRILVVDGNYEGSLQLYLRHQFEGLPLEEEYAKRTLLHLHALWGRPVYLETKDIKDKKQRTKIIVTDKNGIRTLYPEDFM